MDNFTNNVNNGKAMVLELRVGDNIFEFASSIASAISFAEVELSDLEEQIGETLESIKALTPDCDKLDYALAACSGVLCSIIDIFLVGNPSESPLGNITDKWIENRTKDFAKLCGWNGEDSNISSAIKYLEKKFKIPYDQRGAGDAAGIVFDLNPKNHHFKSLGHNPTILGLFFSILDQFTNTSHFVSGDELIGIIEADNNFELRGNNVPSKLFCAFVNWIGHLISDVSGSSGSKGRGMGIPSPFWAWTNDVIAVKRQLKISISNFDKYINELALKIYKEGYDIRFQTAQAIPVFINEMLVRLLYSIRRAINYFLRTENKERSSSLLWKSCEPFSNATVKRMLTVAHGTFCLIDLGDAAIRGVVDGGGVFNVTEFFMRLNIVGVGRFGISLFGEIKRGSQFKSARDNVYFFKREKVIVIDYIEGLKLLSEAYDDKPLLTFVDDLQKSDMYKEAFLKTVKLAEKRNVSSDKILKTKSDIDAYFQGGKN